MAHPVLSSGPGFTVRFVFCLAFWVFALLPGAAFAQSITVGTQIEHSIDHDGELTEIYYTECVQNGTITIPITLVDPGDHDLWVWAGVTSCDNDDTRAENAGGRCRDLGRLDDERNVTLRVQDILLPALTNGEAGDVCSQVTRSTVSVFLMLMDGPTTTVTSAKVDFRFDFEGPEAPELEKLGVGERQLFARWDASSSSDIDGYHVFCEPLGGGTLLPDEPGAGGDGGTPTAPEEPAACTPTLLVAGERPPTTGVLRSEKYGRTAEAGGSAKLENWVTYACGVSGVDSQDNLGPLSAIRCGRPEPVTDFFEAYDRAGGQGGGGFCAFGRARSARALAIAGLLGVLLGWRRWRIGRRS